VVYGGFNGRVWYIERGFFIGVCGIWGGLICVWYIERGGLIGVCGI
jgi:hypothetical protein